MRITGPLALILASFAATALAPLAVGQGYDWIDHTISESAGQGVHNAWLARAGFLFWGAGALWLGCKERLRSRAGAVLLALFGLCMLGAAVCSTRSWDPAQSFNPTLDLLHTIFASAMGAAIVLLLAIRSVSPNRTTIGVAALLASILLPIFMQWRPEAAGAAQRFMFALAYAWFVQEAWRQAGNGGHPSAKR